LSDAISRRVRQTVERRAGRRCEYCRCPLAVTTESFAVEHIIPTVRGGLSTLDNLALSCSGCNGHKYDKIAGFDTISEEMVPLYHALHLNREGVVNLRRLLLLADMHPPGAAPDE
jgi:hypothetical protein